MKKMSRPQIGLCNQILVGNITSKSTNNRYLYTLICSQLTNNTENVPRTFKSRIFLLTTVKKIILPTTVEKPISWTFRKFFLGVCPENGLQARLNLTSDTNVTAVVNNRLTVSQAEPIKSIILLVAATCGQLFPRVESCAFWDES
jgi:hypothetical protein